MCHKINVHHYYCDMEYIATPGTVHLWPVCWESAALSGGGLMSFGSHFRRLYAIVQVSLKVSSVWNDSDSAGKSAHHLQALDSY